MGCRRGVLSFKLKFNRTSSMCHTFQLQLQHVTTLVRCKMLNSPSQLSSLPSFSAQLKITRACAYSTQYSCATLTTHLMRTFRRPGRGAKRRGRAGHKHKARKGVIDIFHVGAPAAQRPPAAPARRRPTACARWSVTPLRLPGGQRTPECCCHFCPAKKEAKKSNRYSGFPGGPPP